MITPPVFKQFLASADLKPADLLQRFSYLDHVIFLKDTNQPTIALDAEQYLLVQEDAQHFFKKTDFNTYKKQKNIPKNWLKFHSNPHHTKTGFEGGYVGFIAYDFAAKNQISSKKLAQPALFIGEFKTYLKHTDHGWYFYSYASNAAEIFQTISDHFQTSPVTPTLYLQKPLQAVWSKDQYQAAFQQIQDYIVAGDCYQINLTQKFQVSASGSLLHAADALWQLTNAPYAGYLKIRDFELLSCSPELFIDFLPQRKILTKPIKGTMPRYADPVLDEQSKQMLKNSEKDMAENVMIVDLLRNDLSVYAETGTVKTPKLFNIESFNQVHHMVSEVEAILKPEIDPFTVLMSALPGGSITGAPKIRAIEIIDELEAAPRGAYCGSMGYFNHDGTGSWNILIRSIQKYQDELNVWAGGGITIASDCDAEYQECFDKVEAILNLLNTWYKSE